MPLDAQAKPKQQGAGRRRRHNFYDAEINGSRGKPNHDPHKRNLREEWCLDCYGVGGGQ